MDDRQAEEYFGLPLAKILLADALPAEAFIPDGDIPPKEELPPAGKEPEKR